LAALIQALSLIGDCSVGFVAVAVEDFAPVQPTLQMPRLKSDMFDHAA